MACTKSWVGKRVRVGAPSACLRNLEDYSKEQRLLQKPTDDTFTNYSLGCFSWYIVEPPSCWPAVIQAAPQNGPNAFSDMVCKGPGASYRKATSTGAVTICFLQNASTKSCKGEGDRFGKKGKYQAKIQICRLQSYKIKESLYGLHQKLI